MEDLRLFAALDDNDIRELSPVALAYIGDTVFDLYVRAHLVRHKAGRIETMHRLASGVVNAGAQARAALLLEPALSERERDIFRLGRNAKSAPPKNASREDYALATAVEAVAGYLFLTGRTARLNELLGAVIHHFLGEDIHA